MNGEYLTALLSVWALYAFAALVPGPNTICVTSSALLGGRARGMTAAAGVASATFVWAAFGIFGADIALRARPEASHFLHFAAAAVLAWLGWTTLRAPPAAARRGRGGDAYLRGLLTGCANPISAAIWTTSAGFILATSPSRIEIVLYVASSATLSLAIHGTIALAVSRLARVPASLDRGTLRTLCGAAFIFFAGMMVPL